VVAVAGGAVAAVVAATIGVAKDGKISDKSSCLELMTTYSIFLLTRISFRCRLLF
jgi:hypothetical protein